MLDSYLDAVAHGVGAQSLVVPGPWSAADAEIARLLDLADGVLLTGSPSNIEPRHYAGPVHPGTRHDPPRDALTLPMVRAAIARGVPVLGICRGFQEMNVALGGSLHQRVHEAGFADHREPAGPPEVEYAPAHVVETTEGGLLRRIVGSATLTVNSLHWQGVDRLAAGCRVEARAPDGLIEAFSVCVAERFALAVQWHPEWQWRENRASTQIFEAFGAAVRESAGRRRLVA